MSSSDRQRQSNFLQAVFVAELASSTPFDTYLGIVSCRPRVGHAAPVAGSALVLRPVPRAGPDRLQLD